MLDYKKIIHPITEENTCGINIRISDEHFAYYRELQDKRSSLRAEELKQLKTETTLVINVKEWEKVTLIAFDILTNYSKDLEVSVFLLESLTRTEGFKGLGLGLDIIQKLLAEYGDKLYPLIDNNDKESSDLRLLSISMLSGQYEPGSLITPIYFCNLIKEKSGKFYNVWELKKKLEENNKNSANRSVTKDLIIKSENLKPIINNIEENFLLEIKAELADCFDNFKKLDSALSKVFGQKAPGLTNLSDVINYCFNLINSIAAALEKPINELAVINNSTEDISITDKLNNDVININNISSDQLDYETAVKLLDSLIDFFRKSEPHSPISYVLERARVWSGLSLPELLCEIISDKARAQFCSISGTPYLSNENKNAEEDEKE